MTSTIDVRCRQPRRSRALRSRSLTSCGRARRLSVALLLCAASSLIAAPDLSAETRDWRTWPFSRASPWNMPIGSAAEYVPIPASAPWGLGLVNYEAKWACRVAIATDSDPLVDVLVNNNEPNDNFRFLSGGGRNCDNPAAVEDTIRGWVADPFYRYFPINPWTTTHPTIDNAWQYPLPPLFAEPADTLRPQIRKPVGHCPSPDRDGHMAVVQPDGKVLDTYATVVLADGDIVAHRIATMVDARGSGTGWSNGRRASMLPTFAGLVRLGELESGRIRHALSASVPPAMLKREARWPAFAFDRNPRYTGGLPMGALLAIPADVDLSALGLSPNGLVLARALQQYGLYVVDRGGAGLTIKWDTNTSIRGWPGIADDQIIVRNHLRWVQNNSRAQIGGGGIHRWPLAPAFYDRSPGSAEFDQPPPPNPIRLDAGSTRAYVDTREQIWWPDQWSLDGTTRARRTTPVEGTFDDELYQTERIGTSGYRIPVLNGRYQVVLHFAEMDPAVTGAGQRVMTARVEGQTRSGIDPYKRGGARNLPVVVHFPPVTVADGAIDIELIRTAAQPTAIGGIEITPIAVHTLALVALNASTGGPVPLTARLNAQAIHCGDDCTYVFEFGDGTSAVGRSVSHTYTAPGEYAVMVTVSGNGEVARGVIDVSVH